MKPRPPTRVPEEPGSVEEELFEPEQLVLSDLINRVLDKGVVISANIAISIADVYLVQLDLRLLISSVATLNKRSEDAAKRGHLPVRSRSRP
jgi:hypothetical protein